MGFSLTLMIHSAEEANDDSGVTLWLPEEIIRCGYVNRKIQGLIDEDLAVPNVHLYRAQDVAGTALISLIFKRFPDYVREVGLSAYAPPYLLEGTYHTYDDIQAFYQGTPQYWNVQKEWIAHLKAGEHRLIPKGFGGLAYEVWPNMIVQARHNAGYLLGVLPKPSVLRDINCSVPCQELARWLQSFWELESTSRLKLEENPRAKARLLSWQAQLNAYGSIDAKVVLVFRDCPERF